MITLLCAAVLSCRFSIQNDKQKMIPENYQPVDGKKGTL